MPPGQQLERGLVVLGRIALQQLRIRRATGVTASRRPTQVLEDVVDWPGWHVSFTDLPFFPLPTIIKARRHPNHANIFWEKLAAGVVPLSPPAADH